MKRTVTSSYPGKHCCRGLKEPVTKVAVKVRERQTGDLPISSGKTGNHSIIGFK